MLENQKIMPITGSFINTMIPDTGITNNGLKDWENDFKFMKAVGMDHLFVIRAEFEQGGQRLSSEDPRTTTWKEDACLLDMIFRLADKYEMSLFLGGPISITNLHMGDWKKEIDDNKRYYDRTVAKYADHPCFKGLYVTLEALPWHFNFFDISTAILEFMKENYPEKKTFMSPSFSGPIGNMRQRYTADQWMDIYGRYFYERVAGKLDYCAPQDTIANPACSLGEIQDNGLEEWFSKAQKLFERCGIEFWSNIETFQRPFPGHGEPPEVFRQVDYRTLYMKLATASPYVKKIITYDYFSCMSPNAEWGSSRRLLARYLEIIGRDPALIDEIYG